MRCDRLPPPHPVRRRDLPRCGRPDMVRSRDPGRFGAGVSDIFREIEDELRRDNLLKLWSRYGRYVIAVAVLAVVIAGAIVVWREHLASERRAQGTRYSAALSLVRAGKDAEAAQLFAKLAQEGGGF